YRLERSEGLVLRYLTDAWRTLDRSLTDEIYTPELEDVIDWLRAMIRATDATLLDEWEHLAAGGAPGTSSTHDREAPDTPVVAPTGPPPAWRTAVRTAAFGWVELLAARSHGTLASRCGWAEAEIDAAMAPYWGVHDTIGIDADARSAAFVDIVDEPATDTHGGRWVITQRLADPDGDGDWRFVASVDLATALDEGAPTLVLESLGPFEPPAG
ncbi:MAG: DUF3516 domain-containing protein, partial [Ilumatobacteraceae bacterium]